MKIFIAAVRYIVVAQLFFILGLGLGTDACEDCQDAVASETEIVRVIKQDGYNCFVLKDGKFYPIEGGCE